MSDSSFKCKCVGVFVCYLSASPAKLKQRIKLSPLRLKSNVFAVILGLIEHC